jgi:hypothetical protein
MFVATTVSERKKVDESRSAGWQELEAPDLLVGYMARIGRGRLLTPIRKTPSQWRQKQRFHNRLLTKDPGSYTEALHFLAIFRTL